VLVTELRARRSRRLRVHDFFKRLACGDPESLCRCKQIASPVVGFPTTRAETGNQSNRAGFNQLNAFTLHYRSDHERRLASPREH
jgi:hypothetical protein